VYIYKLIEGEYEYECECLLSHTNCYTKEEFKNIVIGAIRYNRKHLNNFDSDIFDIEETLINVYGFQKYTIPIQAGLSDTWRLSSLAAKTK